MKKSVIVLNMIGMVMFFSCSFFEDNSINEKFVVPPELEVYDPSKDGNFRKLSLTSNNARIYTLVDVSCSTCLLKLQRWNKFQIEILASKISVIPICYSKDNFELLKFLFENNRIGKINLPLFLDAKKEVLRLNEPLVNNLGELTVLTDEDNNILISGSPIDDLNIRKIYLDKIEDLMNK